MRDDAARDAGAIKRGDATGAGVTSPDAVRVVVDDGAQEVLGLLRVLEEAGLKPTTLRLDRPSLDDVFLTLTGRSLREEGA